MFFADNFTEFRRNFRNLFKSSQMREMLLKFCKFLEFLRCKGQTGSNMKLTPPPLRLSGTFLITSNYGEATVVPTLHRKSHYLDYARDFTAFPTRARPQDANDPGSQERGLVATCLGRHERKHRDEGPFNGVLKVFRRFA